jgi:membrane protease YdiL (CAAX protease family)
MTPLTKENFSLGFWLLVLFVLVVIELRKAILVLLKNETQLFLAAQIGLLFLALYPGDKEKKRKEAMNNYRKNIRIYSVLTIVGSLYFISLMLIIFFR